MNAAARRWLADTRGGIAMIFAVAAPIIALLACGAIDLAAVSASKSEMQAAADAAALNAAHQLDLMDEAGVQARADAFVRGELKDASGFTYTVTTDVAADESAVTIAIAGNRPSFFANLLPPGGWDVNVTSTAKPMARRPLCVLNTSTNASEDLSIMAQAQLSAPNCLVSSNSGIKVTPSGRLSAGAVQSALSASGPIFPTAMVGAPEIPDPFASMQLKPDTLPCQLGDLLSILGVLQGTFYIPPGVHCGNVIIGQGQTVVLKPGEHYFLNSRLILRGNGKLTGDDVAVVFGKSSDFQFTDQSEIRLKGRRSGAFAGFVIATTRENTGIFAISSDNAKELLGAIYVPNATLSVSGQGNEVADESAWTVILAKSLQMTGSAKLVVNAEYGGSPVPVPSGVGPLSNVSLSQ